MRKILWLILSALAAYCVFQCVMNYLGFRTGTVTSVLDGDTVIVSDCGRTEKIRFVDVDSPEKSQPFGRAARRFLLEMTHRQVVRIERRGKDLYGRTLAALFLADGTDINEQMLHAGYAWIYHDTTTNSEYRRLQQEARAAHRGLWADRHPQAPWDYRAAHRPALPRYLIE